MQMHTLFRRRPSAVATLTMAALAVAVTVGTMTRSWAQEKPHVIPAPATDQAPSKASSEVAVLAGGCFWGVQGVYQHVKGVTAAMSGYTGGQKNTAQYEIIERGDTGHAESVQVTYDPHQISYGKLLQVFFSVVHNPTQLNRQGPDVGTQYRSAIFPANEEQAKVARAYISQLGQARVFDAAIVTKIEMGRQFYRAEDYHQDFLVNNPRQRYIAINDLPKIEDLKRIFPDLYRPQPVLVASR